MMTGTPMVLLVDDDEFILDMLHAQLLGMGYERVICATSGAQALVELDAWGGSIAAIIFDLTMPDMNGLALIEQLAQRSCAAGIILLSGAQDDLLQNAAQQVRDQHLDLLGVLTKPCATWQLQTLLLGLQHPDATTVASDPLGLAPRRLAQALVNTEFVAWYQPILDSRSGRVLGVEAQARWPGVAGGMIGPARFVPALVAAGLADELFFSIARQTARDLATWRRQQLVVKVALNLSMATARHPATPGRLQQILSAAGVSPSDVVLEISEDQLTGDRVLTAACLTHLSRLGLSLSLEDFGTGYASHAQLAGLPFKEIKIASSLVQRSSADSTAQSVLQMAIALGHKLGLPVVAKGVQTQAQLALVRRLGCHLVQGEYLAAPMPMSACTAFLLQPEARRQLH